MFKAIIDLFFPKLCYACHEVLNDHEQDICTDCRNNLPVTNFHFHKDNNVSKVFYARVKVEYGTALFRFEKKGLVQQLIHNLKYKGQKNIGTFLGEWYANDLKNNPIISTVTHIIPVPLHKKRLKERGYNQVDEFCEALSKELDIPFNKSLLQRKKYSATQTKKNKTERQFDNNNIFDVTFTKKDENKHYLLIDDVITTGATLELCAKTLLKIPNTKISIVTIAFTQS